MNFQIPSMLKTVLNAKFQRPSRLRVVNPFEEVVYHDYFHRHCVVPKMAVFAEHLQT